MSTFSGYRPDTFVFSKNKKIIFDEKFILFERFYDFNGDWLTGNPMANEAKKRIEQQEAATNDDQSASQCWLGVYFFMHGP